MDLLDRTRHADPLHGRLPETLSAPRAPAAEPLAVPLARWRIRVAIAAAATVATAAVVLSLPSEERGSPEEPVTAVEVLAPGGSRAPSELTARTATVVRGRLDALRLRQASLVRSGATLSVACSACSPDAHAALMTILRPGHLAMYDWEASVLAADCEPAPGDAEVTGGTAAGDAGAGSLSHDDAVRRAGRCRAAVPAGTVVVQALSADPAEDPGDTGWFVLRDEPALTGTQLTGARAVRDPETGSASIVFGLTPPGQAAFRRVTAGLARRGQTLVEPGQTPDRAFQHFAIVLDGRALTVPFVDFRANPDGLDGRDGVRIAGGFSALSARAVAAVLRSGTLAGETRPAAAPS